jgi:hypothetical protein
VEVDEGLLCHVGWDVDSGWIGMLHLHLQDGGEDDDDDDDDCVSVCLSICRFEMIAIIELWTPCSQPGYALPLRLFSTCMTFSRFSRISEHL